MVSPFACSVFFACFDFTYLFRFPTDVNGCSGSVEKMVKIY